jgi:hypothetical protein
MISPFAKLLSLSVGDKLVETKIEYERLFKNELDIEIIFILKDEDISNKLIRYLKYAIKNKKPLTEKEKLIFRSVYAKI